MHKCLAHRLVWSDLLSRGSVGQGCDLLLHFSLDLVKGKTTTKKERQLSYTHINSPLTRREKTNTLFQMHF